MHLQKPQIFLNPVRGYTPTLLHIAHQTIVQNENRLITIFKEEMILKNSLIVFYIKT